MRARALLLLAASILGGCSPSYGGLRMTILQGSSTAEVRSSGIELVHGRVVVFEVEALSADERHEYEVSDEVTLESADNEIARLEPGLKVDTWMMFGVTPGTADVEVRINGEAQDVIPVTVVAEDETAPEGS